MKGYFFDQNLPGKIRFKPSLPIFAEEELGENPKDSVIWDFARENDLVIVSKDADFSERIIVSTPPPRVVHLRFGNVRRNQYHEILERVWPRVESMVKTHKLVNVYADRIEGIH